MKKTGTLILMMIFFVSCGDSKKNENNETQNAVGNDKDQHGCISSAGYTWSQIMQDCVRLYETGQRLSSVDETDDAFIITNNKKSKLELFLPNSKTTVILSKSENGDYASDDIVYNKKDSSLTIDGVVKYKLN